MARRAWRHELGLSPAERELLKRDDRGSGVTEEVKDQQAITRIVSLITKSGGDRR